MGMQVYCNNRELWAPSLLVGTLFLSQIRALEPVVGLESGIESPLADMLESDASTFGPFIQRLLHIRRFADRNFKAGFPRCSPGVHTRNTCRERRVVGAVTGLSASRGASPAL